MIFFINNFFCSNRIKKETEVICKETLLQCNFENCRHTPEAMNLHKQYTNSYEENSEQEI